MSKLDDAIRQLRDNSITSLSLYNNNIRDAGARDLAEVLKLNASLTSLDLVYNQIGDDGARDIAEALKLNASLTYLDLHNNNIGDAGARDIAEALKLNASLTYLDLHNNNIGEAGARDIAEALKLNASLTSLDLTINNIGEAGARDLAEALKLNASLTSLDLVYNQIGDDGARDIAEALKLNASLTYLDLRNNNIGDAGARDIAEALKLNASLISLDLCSNSIWEAGARELAEALKLNASLTSLNLYNNNIGAAGARDIAEALKLNASLTSLDLRSNNIGAAGARDIAEALKLNASLTSLDLRSNNIGAAGARDIAEALKLNTSLTSLDLRSNNIGAAGARDIAEALKLNTSLTSLDLRSNNIGAAGARDIAEALKLNTSLTSLDLYDNKIGAAGARDIAEALKLNASLTSLDLRSNNIGEDLLNTIEGYIRRNIDNKTVEANDLHEQAIKLLNSGVYENITEATKLFDNCIKLAEQIKFGNNDSGNNLLKTCHTSNARALDLLHRYDESLKLLDRALEVDRDYIEAKELKALVLEHKVAWQAEEKEGFFEKKKLEATRGTINEREQIIEEKLQILQETTNTIKGDITANKKIDADDKALVQRQLDNILIKIEKTADKVNLDIVTASVKDLIVDGRIVKDRLNDLEEEIAESVKKSIEDQELIVRQQLREQQQVFDKVIDEKLSQMQTKFDEALKARRIKEKNELKGEIQEVSDIKQSVQGLFARVAEQEKTVQGLTLEMTQLLKQDELNTDRFVDIQESLAVVSTHEQAVQELTREMTELLTQDELSTDRFIALQGRIKDLEQKLENHKTVEVGVNYNVDQPGEIKLQEYKSRDEIKEPIAIQSPVQSPSNSRSPSANNFSRVAEDISMSVLKRIKGTLGASNTGANEQEEIFTDNLAKELKKHSKGLLETSSINGDTKKDFMLAIVDKLLEENEEKHLFIVEEVPLHVREQGFKITEALQRTKLFRIDNVKLNKKGYLKSLLETVNREVAESLNMEEIQSYAVTDIEYDNPVLKDMEALKDYYHKYGAKATNALISIGHILTQGQAQDCECYETEVIGSIYNNFNDIDNQTM